MAAGDGPGAGGETDIEVGADISTGAGDASGAISLAQPTDGAFATSTAASACPARCKSSRSSASTQS